MVGQVINMMKSRRSPPHPQPLKRDDSYSCSLLAKARETPEGGRGADREAPVLYRGGENEEGGQGSPSIALFP